jgi:hypothetical protein
VNFILIIDLPPNQFAQVQYLLQNYGRYLAKMNPSLALEQFKTLVPPTRKYQMSHQKTILINFCFCFFNSKSSIPLQILADLDFHLMIFDCSYLYCRRVYWVSFLDLDQVDLLLSFVRLH